MGDEGKAVGIAQAPAALLSARSIAAKTPLMRTPGAFKLPAS